jgi:hypothetical protein
MEKYEETECNRRHDNVNSEVRDVWAAIGQVKNYFIMMLSGLAATLLTTVVSMILVLIKVM